MERAIFVLPIDKYGMPHRIERFLEEEELQGQCFESMSNAEKLVLELKEKHSLSFDYYSFGIFELTAYAVPSPCGHKIVETVETTRG